MFKLQNLNIVKLVETEDERDKLIAKGFSLVEDEKIEDPSKGSGNNNYSEMTISDLQVLCKEKGLSGYSNLSKDELVKFAEENLTADGKK